MLTSQSAEFSNKQTLSYPSIVTKQALLKQAAKGLKQALGLIWLFFLLSCNANASEHTKPDEKASILIFYQADREITANFIEHLTLQLEKNLPTQNYKLVDTTRLNINEINNNFKTDTQCSLTIGESVTQKVLSTRRTSKVFTLMVSRNQLDKLRRVYQRLGISVSGIYQEQSFQRQLYLSQTLDPKLKQVGVLLGQNDKFTLTELEKTAKKSGLNLNYRILHPSDPPDKYLPDVANKNDFFLILNNPTLFLKSRLAGFVLSSYYHEIRLVGNQKNDTLVGALAAVYTPAVQLAGESVNKLKSFCIDNKNTAPAYAKNFSVIVNQQVANNLNMEKFDLNLLINKISLMESKQIRAK